MTPMRREPVISCVRDAVLVRVGWIQQNADGTFGYLLDEQDAVDMQFHNPDDVPVYVVQKVGAQSGHEVVTARDGETP